MHRQVEHSVNPCEDDRRVRGPVDQAGAVLGETAEQVDQARFPHRGIAARGPEA